MGSTSVAQVRRLNYSGEDIGMGFNSDTGLGVGTALEFELPASQESQETEADVTIITSHEELMSTLHMSAEMEGRYAFSTAGGKVDFAKKTQYNSSSTFVVARMVINNTVKRGRGFRLRPDLQHLLNPDQEETFARAFGDSFVRAHYNGGEFYAVMRVTSVDSRTESQLAVSLHAAVQGGLAAAEFKAQMDQANSSARTRSEFSVHYYQKGGLGREETGATLDVGEIKQRLKDFPEAVRNHPFPYYIEVATYDTVPLPLPTKQQRDDFLLALADANARKLKYLQKRNDCEFAAEHPEFFVDPPPRGILLAMAGTYLQLVNGVIAHAVRLSNGQLPEPQLFDPSKLSPPVIEPALVLRKRDVGLERSFSDWWVTHQQPGTRRNDRDLVTDIAFVAMDQLNAFHEIVDPGGNAATTERLRGDALARVVASLREYDWAHAGMHDANRAALTSLSSLPTMLPLTIKSLAFAQNAITDTRGLDPFTTLVSLDLSHNAITSIAELASLPALRTLRLVDNRISDLGPLSGCTSLETLDLSGNDIGDLTPLRACTQLRNLTLTGTVLFSNGVRSRSGNPIEKARALGEVPFLANPFTRGNVLAVRFGVLSEGPERQWTGTATRVGDSHTFRVRLTRSGEVVDDAWSLRSIWAVTPSGAEEMAMFAPGVRAGDVPASGASLSVTRASMGDRLEINISYADPATPERCGVDLSRYPVFGTLIPLTTFDAVIVS